MGKIKLHDLVNLGCLGVFNIWLISAMAISAMNSGPDTNMYVLGMFITQILTILYVRNMNKKRLLDGSDNE